MINQTIYGDCREIMADWILFNNVKVQMCVTSPPYFGLRDYGVDGQIGLEETPQQYVDKMVEVFRLVRDILADDGTLWLNLGDTYANSGTGGHGATGGLDKSTLASAAPFGATPVKRSIPSGLKSKDLIGIPWRVAFALQADGWYLRQDIIWHKPNPMPESVLDRCTRSHEYVFLLTKQPKYFFDSEAIKEPCVRPDEGKRKTPAKFGGANKHELTGEQSRLHSGNEYLGTADGKRNRRDVWTIASQPYKGAHFACFPQSLIEPCILAGTSAVGHCVKCAARAKRVVEREFVPQEDVSINKGIRGHAGQKPMDESNSWQGFPRGTTKTNTTGWAYSCECNQGMIPDVVFDPFMGSGTTAEVAKRLGRNYLGCELNPAYRELQEKRIASIKEP